MSESNQPESSPRETEDICFTLEAVEGEVFIASPDSEQFETVETEEIRWLEAVSYSQDGVSIHDVLDEDDTPTLETYRSYMSARDSLVEKLNQIFGREVLQVTQVVDEELLHAAPNVDLYKSVYVRRDRPIQPVYGHPSTLVHLGARGLLEAKGHSAQDPLPPDLLLGFESRVRKQITEQRHMYKNFNKREFSDHNPLISAVSYAVLKRIYPDAAKEDIDWMVLGACVDADTAAFSSPYKSDIKYGKQLCENCPVQQNCHDFAIKHRIKAGLWGGGDEKERRDREFSANVGRMMEDVQEAIGGRFQERRRLLANETASWLRLYIEDSEGSALKEAQIPAFASIAAHFENGFSNPDGFISMPTGTGKTVIFIEFIRSVGLKTVVLVPRQQLVHQTVSEFANFHEEGDVGMIYADEKQTGSDITVTTYQSFVRHVTQRTGLFSPEDIELLVLDEAHGSLSPRNRELLESLVHIPKIGFTATDEYDQDKTLSNLLPSEIYRMEIPEAIDSGLIAPYRTILVDTDADLSNVRISPSTKDFVEKELAEAVDNLYRNDLAAHFYNSHFRDQKAVFFCASIKHAKAVATQLRELGIRAEATYGKQPKDKKQQVLEQLATPIDQGGLEVVCNAKLLTEGWDNPAVSVCFNLAPTLSKVLARQRSGRTLRTDSASPNKVATIVEFIDREYARPPVTFPDPEVAQEATYFPKGEVPPHQLLAIEGEGITTDPAAIKDRAYEMNAQRRQLAGLPPHDWRLLPQIVRDAMKQAGAMGNQLAEALFDSYNSHQVSDHYIKSALSQFPDGYRWVRDGRNWEYAFSPEVADIIKEQMSTSIAHTYGNISALTNKQ